MIYFVENILDTLSLIILLLVFDIYMLGFDIFPALSVDSLIVIRAAFSTLLIHLFENQFSVFICITAACRQCFDTLLLILGRFKDAVISKQNLRVYEVHIRPFTSFV